MKYRKKPVVIEAYQVPPEGEDCPEEMVAFLRSSECEIESLWGGSILIHTLEGTMTAGPKDWIIRGVKGEFYPCKPDIFEATYEPMDAEPAGGPRPTAPGIKAARERFGPDYPSDG